MQKVFFLFLISLICFGILYGNTLDIKYVTYSGFEDNFQTTLTINIFVDGFTQAEQGRLWIEPADAGAWLSGYYNNGTSNYFSYNVDPAMNGTVIQQVLYITPVSLPSIRELDIKTWDGISAEDFYELKAVIDTELESSILNPTQQQELAEKFLPILRMDDGSQIEDDFSSTNVGAEKFLPQSIDVLVNDSEIRNGTEGSNYFVAEVSKENLALHCDKNNFIKFHQGNDPGDIIDWYNVNKDSFNTQVYASFLEESDKIIITYWFFYLFNDNTGWGFFYGIPTNQHLGEWEGVSIVFNKTDIETNYNTAIPIKAAVSSHTDSQTGKRRDNWNNIEKIAQHPVLYVCNGSHATFFHRGKSENEASAVRDYHYGDGVWVAPNEPEILNEIDEFCTIYGYSYQDISYYGFKGNDDTGVQVEILPRLNDIPTNDYWHTFSGKWGNTWGIFDDEENRIASNSPLGPPLVASKHNSNSTDGYKWFKALTWVEQQEYDPNLTLIVDFSVDQTSGNVPLSVSFSDLSSELVTSWQWDFDNDGTIDSFGQNPNWTFNSAGSYSVSLAISDGIDTITKTITDYITVFSAPDNLAISIAGNEVQLNWDAVSGAMSYKVYSSDDSYTGFTEDTTGLFGADSWTTSVVNEKKFYYVKAVY